MDNLKGVFSTYKLLQLFQIIKMKVDQMNPDDWETYEELSYKWKTEGSSKELLQLFKNKINRKTIENDYLDDFWLTYLSILSEQHKRSSFNELLTQYTRKYGNSKIPEYILVGRKMKNDYGKKCNYIYKKLKKMPIEKELKKILSNKTVAVVGNSDCELGKNKGPEIDNHDIVIRFNNYLLADYSEDYGLKTNIWVRNLENNIVDRTSEQFDLIIYSADLLHYPIKKSLIDTIYSTIQNGKILTSFDSKSYMFLKDKGLKWPTSGASVIASIFLTFKSLNNIDFYGFSFLENNPSFKHYYQSDENRLLIDHNMAKEIEIIKKMIRSGTV